MASHEDAIDQLCAITATETTMGRRSIEQVLRSTDWNVEVSPLFLSARATLILRSKLPISSLAIPRRCVSPRWIQSGELRSIVHAVWNLDGVREVLP